MCSYDEKWSISLIAYKLFTNLTLQANTEPHARFNYFPLSVRFTNFESSLDAQHSSKLI